MACRPVVIQKVINSLIEKGLIFERDGKIVVRDWAKHQYSYESKRPSNRVRGNLGEVSGKVDTDTDTDTEPDTETEKDKDKYYCAPPQKNAAECQNLFSEDELPNDA
jgi:hypothetical protein